MSVLVREEKTGKHYVIVKGAPEKIQSVSTSKIGGYSNFISDMSFRGLRTIAFGYKIIT
jgi:magnesium-transporting ATPase (P-type)